jgi:hypothetical protein
MTRTIGSALLVVLFASTALAQEKASKPADPPAAAPQMSPKQMAAMQKMMEAMQAHATLGPEHAELKKMAGTWDVAVKMWPDAGMPAQEFSGKAEMKMILGDHYLQQEFSSTMMGQPFNGIAITGYDNSLKQYESIWIDSMGTSIMWAEGKASKDGKTITMKTEATDPVKKKIVKGREILRIESDTKHVMEMYGPSLSGKEFKVMEITYTKK